MCKKKKNKQEEVASITTEDLEENKTETEQVEEQKVEEKEVPKKKKGKIRDKRVSFIARAAVFSAIATLFYIIPVPPFNFPIFPGAFSFLKVHIDEVPVLIASFAYGPLMGVIVLVVKTLIKLPLSSTGFIGELGDLVYSLGFVLPAAFIYKQNRKFSGAVLALIIGFVTQIGVSTVYNFYVQYHLYNSFYGGLPFTLDDFIAIVIPFNAIKNAIVIAITMPIYKSVHRFFDRI